MLINKGISLSVLISFIRLPARASDIDGVVVRGSTIIGNSNKMVPELLTPRPAIDNKTIPFILLTNGGGFIEDKKAEEMNKVLGLESH